MLEEDFNIQFNQDDFEEFGHDFLNKNPCIQAS